ncbi:hypothetical protein GCM10020229_81060 [Kitasatospora albolonga]|uniref:hypothetical protein n=1 Tax=Kitasatospora albolonga TaxID=68173 RepID=UPI0031E8AAA6
MDDEQSFHRYGLRPVGADLDEIRSVLREHTRLERQSQGYGDTELMKLCCVQLFNSGGIDDVLLVWSAKRASFDAGCSIDIELLLGHGLDATKEYLSAHPEPSAAEALDRLSKLEADGAFEGFSVEERSALYDMYYRGY